MGRPRARIAGEIACTVLLLGCLPASIVRPSESMSRRSFHPPIRVLVVEDDHDARTFLVGALAAAGFSVTAARDGQEAIERLERGEVPDAFIVDLELPRVSGRDLLRFVSDDRVFRTIPVVVTTAHPDWTRGVVADAVFEKPFDVELVRQRIQDLVKRSVL